QGTRQYSNFCAVAHTPFDLTLTFCDVQPLSENDLKMAEQSQTVRAPVIARIALPFGVVPGLITALQEQMRAVQSAQTTPDPATWPKGPLHYRSNADARPSRRESRFRSAREAASQRVDRTPLQEPIRIARRHDSFRAVHRSAE